jgi:hypothetical protein
MYKIEKLRETFRRDAEHLVNVFAEHVKDGWFTNDSIILEWDVPMPYFGALKLRKVSTIPNEKKIYDLPSSQKHYPVYLMSLHRDRSGECNFPRRIVSDIARDLAYQINAQVFADFYALCNSDKDYFDYDGEVFEIKAYRLRADFYGKDIFKL